MLERVLTKIAVCKIPEVTLHTVLVSESPRCDHSIFNPDQADLVGSVITLSTSPIAHIKYLTLRCSAILVPLFSSHHNTAFPSSATLERIRTIAPGPFLVIKRCQVLDATFLDTYRHPSSKELELCSSVVIQTGKKGRDMYERFCMDE